MSWPHKNEAYRLLALHHDDRCEDKRRLAEIVPLPWRVPVVGWREDDGTWVEAEGGDGPFIAKPFFGESGHGVIRCDNRDDCPSGSVLTPLVIQHAKLSRIWPRSVASLRVLVLDGNVIGTLWMIGTQKTWASNDSSGCLWAHVDSSGAIDRTSARRWAPDPTKRVHVAAHPVSRVPVVGVQFDLSVPKETSIRLSAEAGLKISGWDWAVTDEGEWKVMEVNSRPAIGVHYEFDQAIWPIVRDSLDVSPPSGIVPPMEMEIFEVGGCLRDELMGVDSKDVDFVVLADSFDAMHERLLFEGFKPFVIKPEFVTIRAGVPKDHPLRERTHDADFVLARKDSASGDGRRPDFVEPGTLMDDLSRRDFTMNAIARHTVTGEIVDPFGGRGDIMDKSLVFVGDPFDRIREDGLRVLRGFRFMITKGVAPKGDTFDALVSDLAVEMLACVSVERISVELEKMFRHNTLQTMDLFGKIIPRKMQEAMFRDGLWLTPTLKGRGK